MHKRHKIILEQMLGIESGSNRKLSDAVISRIERAERRILKRTGSFWEMNASELAILVNDLPNAKCVVIPKDEKKSKQG